jgi:CBS domain-containing protein
MVTIERNLLSLNAGDVMSASLMHIPQEMSLVGAAHLLLQGQVSGAPVVDNAGRCAGVLSATDFMRWAEKGACPPYGGRREYREPYCSAWGMLEIEVDLPDDEVKDYMTRDPVVVSKRTSVAEVARIMVDAHIHRVIVVDANQRPIGIVSSTDILAVLARAEPPKYSTWVSLQPSGEAQEFDSERQE